MADDTVPNNQFNYDDIYISPQAMEEIRQWPVPVASSGLFPTLSCPAASGLMSDLIGPAILDNRRVHLDRMDIPKDNA